MEFFDCFVCYDYWNGCVSGCDVGFGSKLWFGFYGDDLFDGYWVVGKVCFDVGFDF